MSFHLSERISSFRHALGGIFLVVRTQHNAWVHAAATVAVTALGLYISLNALEWCVIVLAVALVWIAEALNTALEFLADEVTLERRDRIRRAKDAAAGAVLLASIASVILGLLVFVPHLRH